MIPEWGEAVLNGGMEVHSKITHQLYNRNYVCVASMRLTASDWSSSLSTKWDSENTDPMARNVQKSMVKPIMPLHTSLLTVISLRRTVEEDRALVGWTQVDKVPSLQWHMLVW